MEKESPEKEVGKLTSGGRLVQIADEITTLRGFLTTATTQSLKVESLKQELGPLAAKELEYWIGSKDREARVTTEFLERRIAMLEMEQRWINERLAREAADKQREDSQATTMLAVRVSIYSAAITTITAIIALGSLIVTAILRSQ